MILKMNSKPKEASKMELDHRHISMTLATCILELMKVEDYPKVKEIQLMLQSVRRLYRKE